MTDWVNDLFQAIDEMNADKFSQFLDEDATFQFGNAKPVRGRGSVRDAVASFFSSIKGISHRLLGEWHVDNVFFVQGEVTYARKDAKTVRVPFLDLLKLNDQRLVSEYVIYVDVSPLYA